MFAYSDIGDQYASKNTYAGLGIQNKMKTYLV